VIDLTRKGEIMTTSISDAIVSNEQLEAFANTDMGKEYHNFFYDHISKLAATISEICKGCFASARERAAQGHYDFVIGGFFGTEQGATLLKNVLWENYKIKVIIQKISSAGDEYKNKNSFGTIYKVDMYFKLQLEWGPSNEFIYSNPIIPDNPYNETPETRLQEIWDKAQCGVETDVTFEMDDQSFTAHSPILKMKSTAFQKLLDHPGSIKIPERCIKVFKQFLEFIYIGKLNRELTREQYSDFSQEEPQFLHEVVSLLYLAKEFEVNQLKDWCNWEINRSVKKICKSVAEGSKQLSDFLNLVTGEPVKTVKITLEHKKS
jgi:BTB/POZ domain